MKINMDKLGINNIKHEKIPFYKKKILYPAVCLFVLSMAAVFKLMGNIRDVSAKTPYDASYTNPSFTVQHVGDVETVNLQEGSGEIPVLTGSSGNFYAELNEDGTIKTVKNRMPLYEDYTTEWIKTDSVEAMSFLDEGYVLKEIWLGKDKTSENSSDFMILKVSGNVSDIFLTNNPDHPKLSETKENYYMPDPDGKYTVCIENGDVVRLIFEAEDNMEKAGADIFDYDVSDGGYYLSMDYYNKGERYPVSSRNDTDGIIYADAVENGIHSPENYSGSGAKFAFGGPDIGTDLDEEIFGDMPLNAYNTGTVKGLSAGIDRHGSFKWSDGVFHPDLFGTKDMEGKTSYTNEEYSFVFKKNGFNRTLSGVEFEYGSNMEGLDMFTDINGKLTNSFWILDTAPSYNTDGHDPAWGNGSDKTHYYRDGDRATLPFKPSDDMKNHNSFFGLSYTEDFILPPGYTGVLDFFGYSDDDMWVFAAQVDDNGQVMTDTMIQVTDLGGIHGGMAYYCNLWDEIDKIPYGAKPQKWRLFVFWLERDGSSSSCYLNFTLPEETEDKNKETVSVEIAAASRGSFIFDDGTGNRYEGVYEDETKIIITSGKKFIIPDKSSVTIKGITRGNTFIAGRTGNETSTICMDDKYIKAGSVAGTAGINERIMFL